MAAKTPPLEELFGNYVRSKGNAITLTHKRLLEYFIGRVIKDLAVTDLQGFIVPEFRAWLDAMPIRRTAREIQISVRAAFNYADAVGLTCPRFK